MTTNYPGAVDSLTNPAAGDALNSPSHAAQHANANDAIEAVQTELGANPSGSESTVVARLEKIEDGTRLGTGSVGATQLANDAVGTAAIQNGAVTSAQIADGTIVSGDVAASTFVAFGTVGNLLTANQASAESGATTGWSSANVTLTASTDRAVDGTYSFKLVTTADAAVWMGQGTGVANYVPVTAGETYTATADWYVPSTNTGTIGASTSGPVIYWYTAAGVYVSDTGGALGAPPEDAWTTRKVTAVAPATAAYARLFSIYTSSSYLKANDVVYIDRVGLWKGASGRWAMPGVPITGQSHIAVNNAVHLSGTGTPEGVVTAPPGSTFLQTDSTTDVKGWIRWIKATGTGNTGWVAGPEADTGIRKLTLINGWSGGAYGVYLRRIGSLVHCSARDLSGASGTDVNFAALPSGFLPTYIGLLQFSIAKAGGTFGNYGLVNTTNLRIEATPTDYTSARFSTSWTTTDTWPSSLPGSAV